MSGNCGAYECVIVYIVDESDDINESAFSKFHITVMLQSSDIKFFYYVFIVGMGLIQEALIYFFHSTRGWKRHFAN